MHATHASTHAVSVSSSAMMTRDRCYAQRLANRELVTDMSS
jgi:hypothetical protein